MNLQKGIATLRWIQWMQVAIAGMLMFTSCNEKKVSVPDNLATLASEQTDTLRMIFVGDVMQHLPQVHAARTSDGYDYNTCFQYVKDEIAAADVAVANLETTLGGKPYKGYPCFSSPDELLVALKTTGFDVIATANNHCVDRGKRGLERTNTIIDSLKLYRLGTYKNQTERENKYPLLLKTKGFRIALLNYTYGTNGIPVASPNVVNLIDTTVIEADIAKAKTMNPDAIIACMHWGLEYQTHPNGEQLHLANWLLQKGVHHIIGSHPHVIQPIEVREGENNSSHLIAYSLGNYISNQSDRRTDGGLTLTLELVKDNTTRLNKYWYRAVWVARPAISGWKNYQLIPENISQNHTSKLPQNAQNAMQTFFKDTEKLLKDGLRK